MVDNEVDLPVLDAAGSLCSSRQRRRPKNKDTQLLQLLIHSGSKRCPVRRVVGQGIIIVSKEDTVV